MNEAIKKNGIKFGIILGLIGILSQVTVYLLGGITKENAITGSVIQIVFWLAYLITRIVQSLNTKKELNGFISFKDLFTTLTITITIGILISQIFTFLLNNFIDAEYGKLMNAFINEQQVVAANAMKSFSEVSTEDLKEMAKTDNFSIVKILQGSAMAFLISSIMNLILSAIFKSKTNTLNE